MSSKVGSKTVKFNANGGIVAGALKTKKGHVISMPIAYKNGYKFKGWYSGKTKTSNLNLSLASLVKATI